MKKYLILSLIGFILVNLSPLYAQRTKLPAGATITWDEPKANSVVANPVKFKMSATNLDIASTKKKGSSHFHILYDRQDIVTMIKNDDAFKPGPQLIPKDIHLGNGEIEYELDLPPGSHILQLLITDQNHISYFPALFTEQRKITVK